MAPAAWPPPAGGGVMRRVGEGEGEGKAGEVAARRGWCHAYDMFGGRALLLYLSCVPVLSCSRSPFRLSLVAHSCQAHIGQRRVARSTAQCGRHAGFFSPSIWVYGNARDLSRTRGFPMVRYGRTSLRMR